jgi:hypothetical protein
MTTCGDKSRSRGDRDVFATLAPIDLRSQEPTWDSMSGDQTLLAPAGCLECEIQSTGSVDKQRS